MVLHEHGMRAIAFLAFFASVAVPIMKLTALMILLISIQRGWRSRPRERTAIYRVVETIGRWSMLDIFVMTILVALVQLQSVATIEAGIGAKAFAAVVVAAMAAAHTFDPRLIWDQVATTEDLR